MCNSLFSELQIVQLNLHHAISATKNLNKGAEDQEISIACIQEIYQKNNRPIGFPSNVKTFFSDRDNLKSGIIVYNKYLQAIKVFSSSNIIAVTIPFRKSILMIISVYYPPSEEIETTLIELENCLQHSHDRVLIAGDFNVKSTIWGDDFEDYRGRILLEFLFSKGLVVLNDENSPPTFGVSLGRSWIDITISEPILSENIFKWKIYLEPTSSDHNSISFSLSTERPKMFKDDRIYIEN
ncbi:hypothetical protein HNY73_021248 [Argiope bruennichi]|uniref:Endonuclease/exonuclease/phosphatase domain-containing protein n=1 Tax=Argiope bruennichi TaxID=94029 RepID=A0A8T0EE45_ARGBR|nr:hypothetical protein HNY73_021248 [Argiope bruennichi]